MKKQFFIILAIVSVVMFVNVAGVYYSAQPPFGYTGANGSTCAQCHGNFNNGGGNVTAIGLPTSGFTDGQSYNFSLQVSHPTVRGRWGFSIAARDANNQPVGVFSTTNPNAGPNGEGELSHFPAVLQTSTSFTFNNLQWTAPVNPTQAQRFVTFHYIANAANADFGLTGDFIYSGTANAAYILPNFPPNVFFTSPNQNSSFAAGSSIKLVAAATDTLAGSVSKVEFFLANAGLIKLGEDVTSPYELSGNDVEPGIYKVLAKATDDQGAIDFSDTLQITVNSCVGTGSITAQGYTGISGDLLINLANSNKYPSNPDITVSLDKFEYGPAAGDNYGARVRGYICAPSTGDYVFYIASDNQSELWLSTNASPLNIRRIANVESQTGFRSYFGQPSQRSAPIRLIKGARYYIETIHKEGTTTDHLSVSWLLPNGVLEGPIPGTRLSPWDNAPIVQGSKKTSFEEEMRAKSLGWLVKLNSNPTTDFFRVNINSKSSEPIEVKLLNSIGQLIEIKRISLGQGIIDIGSKAKAGIYFIEVTQGNKKERMKAIKQ